MKRTRKQISPAAWIVAWNNPYTAPPGPHELARVEVPEWHGGHPPQEIISLCDANPGYGIHWSAPKFETRNWTPEQKAALRIRALQRRIEKAAPLFRDEFVQRELEKNPEYFKGITR